MLQKKDIYRIQEFQLWCTNGRFNLIKPPLQRLITFLTRLIFSILVTVMLYQLFLTGKASFIYYQDSRILKEIKMGLDSGLNVYSINESTHTDGVTYFSSERSLYDKFSKLSYYDGVNFNPFDVKGNYERYSGYRSHPFWDFFNSIFIYCFGTIFLWWLLLRASTWIIFGSRKYP
jgi:hypothetical protein